MKNNKYIFDKDNSDRANSQYGFLSIPINSNGKNGIIRIYSGEILFKGRYEKRIIVPPEYLDLENKNEIKVTYKNNTYEIFIKAFQSKIGVPPNLFLIKLFIKKNKICCQILHNGNLINQRNFNLKKEKDYSQELLRKMINCSKIKKIKIKKNKIIVKKEDMKIELSKINEEIVKFKFIESDRFFYSYANNYLSYWSEIKEYSMWLGTEELNNEIVKKIKIKNF